MDLGIAQLRTGNAFRFARTPWQSRWFRFLPLSEELQEDIPIMGKGIGGKQRKGSVQASLNLSKKSTGTIEITISDQRSQTETNLWSKGPPDPGGPQTSAPTFLKRQRVLGIIAVKRSWCFF
jgi:hypothetical protein